MFEVAVEQGFASAHALRNYKGRCENVHGHNWKVQVVIEGEKLDETGMLVDFLDVKRLMGDIVDRLDHQFLNEIRPFDVNQSLGGKSSPNIFTGDERKIWRTRTSPCASAK